VIALAPLPIRDREALRIATRRAQHDAIRNVAPTGALRDALHRDALGAAPRRGREVHACAESSEYVRCDVHQRRRSRLVA